MHGIVDGTMCTMLWSITGMMRVGTTICWAPKAEKRTMDEMGRVVGPIDTCGLAPESGFCSSPKSGSSWQAQPNPALAPTAFHCGPLHSSVECSRERPKRSTASQPTEFSGQKHFSPACQPASQPFPFLDECSETTLETSQDSELNHHRIPHTTHHTPNTTHHAPLARSPHARPVRPRARPPVEVHPVLLPCVPATLLLPPASLQKLRVSAQCERVTRLDSIRSSLVRETHTRLARPLPTPTAQG